MEENKGKMKKIVKILGEGFGGSYNCWVRTTPTLTTTCRGITPNDRKMRARYNLVIPRVSSAETVGRSIWDGS
jgi:hypothetical protein